MSMCYIVILILFGVLFLVAELVLLPGFSVGAVLSLVCYGSAVYMAFRDYDPLTGCIVVGAVLLLSLVATVVSLRAKTWQRFSLRQEIDSSSMSSPESELKVGDAGSRFRAWPRWARSTSAAAPTKPSRSTRSSIPARKWRSSDSRISMSS